MKIAELTISRAAEGLKKREFSSRELTAALLAAISDGNRALGAYLSVNEEDALAQADAADVIIASGRGSTLAGVPLALKDSISVAGQPCTCASRMLENYVAPYDATVSQRLRSAGALLVGRTNLDEFSLGASTESSAFQVTHNPHDLSRSPGGSSGGSAAAVAGGLAVAALGTDAGGSVRQPAAYCGCVGVRPVYGRTSRYGVVPCVSSMDQVGTLTKSVADAALLLSVLAGSDPLDNLTLGGAVPDYLATLEDGFKGLRIGVPREYFEGSLAAEVADSVQRAIDCAAAGGAQIVAVSLPHTKYAQAAYCVIAAAEASANLAHIDGVRYGYRAEAVESVFDLYAQSRGRGFGMEVKRRILLGTYVLGKGNYDTYFERAQRVRTLITNDFAAAFQTCDLLFAPVTPTVAPPLGAFSETPLEMYRREALLTPASLAGCCALSLPCGASGAGLPVGLQIIGSGDERLMLRAARALERAMPQSGGASA